MIAQRYSLAVDRHQPPRQAGRQVRVGHRLGDRVTIRHIADRPAGRGPVLPLGAGTGDVRRRRGILVIRRHQPALVLTVPLQPHPGDVRVAFQPRSLRAQGHA